MEINYEFQVCVCLVKCTVLELYFIRHRRVFNIQTLSSNQCHSQLITDWANSEGACLKTVSERLSHLHIVLCFYCRTTEQA